MHLKALLSFAGMGTDRTSKSGPVFNGKPCEEYGIAMLVSIGAPTVELQVEWKWVGPAR